MVDADGTGEILAQVATDNLSLALSGQDLLGGSEFHDFISFSSGSGAQKKDDKKMKKKKKRGRASKVKRNQHFMSMH